MNLAFVVMLPFLGAFLPPLVERVTEEKLRQLIQENFIEKQKLKQITLQNITIISQVLLTKWKGRFCQ